MKNSFNSLYVNGCSFTAGHELLDIETWPVQLANKLNVDFTSQAANGQSFDSIFLNTINHLSKYKPEETLVVIGLTWPTRIGALINGMTVNLTPADLGRNKTDFEDKFNKWRRLKTPYSIESNALDLEYKDYEGTPERYYKPLEYLSRYYESLVSLDKNLDRDLSTTYLTHVLALQGYLKSAGFTYRFIDFQNTLDFLLKSFKELAPLGRQLDSLITYHLNEEDELYNGHPTAEDCKTLATKIYASI